MEEMWAHIAGLFIDDEELPAPPDSPVIQTAPDVRITFQEA